MAEAIDSFVQYEGKQAEEIFKLPFVENPSLAEQGVKVISDVKSNLYIYFTTKLSKITKKRDGCGNVITGDGVNVTRRPMEVTDMNIYLPQCADIFNRTIKEFALKSGVEINDLTDTQIDTFIKELIMEAAKEDYLVQLWFADTSLVGDDFYNVYDGWFVRIAAGVLANTIPNHVITAMSVPADAYNALLAVWNNQARAMKRQKKAVKQILVTQNIAELYDTYLSTLNGSEVSYVNLTNGIEVPMFKGVPVIPIDIWDEVFDADFPSDYGFGRIVMTVDEESLIVPLDVQGDETLVQSWYSLDDDVQKYRVRYKVGTDIKYHEMLSVAGFDVSSSS